MTGRVWTYDLAIAAGRDAANNQARKAGRQAWNRADWNLAAATTDRLLPLPGDTPGEPYALCGTIGK